MKRKTFEYPVPQQERSGCKVGWVCYKKKSDATRAARVAKAEAKHLSDLGFDFGFQSPGSIRKNAATGLWEVVTP